MAKRRLWMIQGKAYVALTLIAGVASAAIWTLVTSPAIVGPEPIDVGEQVDIVGVRPLPPPPTVPTPGGNSSPEASPSATESAPGGPQGSGAGQPPADRQPPVSPSPGTGGQVPPAPGAGTPADTATPTASPQPTPTSGTVRGDAFPGGEPPRADGGAGNPARPTPSPRPSPGPPSPNPGNGPPSEPPGRSFSLAGGLDGLYPGAVMALRLTVTNDHPFAIDVLDIQTAIGDSSQEGCAATDIAVDPWGGRVTIPGRATGTIDVVISMSHDATDACQGASWPLTFRSSAVRSEP